LWAGGGQAIAMRYLRFAKIKLFLNRLIRVIINFYFAIPSRRDLSLREVIQKDTVIACLCRDAGVPAPETSVEDKSCGAKLAFSPSAPPR
jgi:hypothetical protein